MVGADYQRTLLLPTKFKMVMAAPLEILFKSYNLVVFELENR